MCTLLCDYENMHGVLPPAAGSWPTRGVTGYGGHQPAFSSGKGQYTAEQTRWSHTQRLFGDRVYRLLANLQS